MKKAGIISAATIVALLGFAAIRADRTSDGHSTIRPDSFSLEKAELLGRILDRQECEKRQARPVSPAMAKAFDDARYDAGSAPLDCVAVLADTTDLQEAYARLGQRSE